MKGSESRLSRIRELDERLERRFGEQLQLNDRLDRRLVYAASLVVQIAVASGVFLYGRSDPDRVWPFFVLMAVYGAARAGDDSA